MVYFGPRKYRPSARGMDRREKMRVIGPVLLLLVLFLIVVVPRWSDQNQAPEAPPGMIPVGHSDEVVGLAPDDQTPNEEANVPEPVALSPEDQSASGVEPFVVDESILARVRDGEAVDPGPLEEEAKYYLLHRWRAGASEPAAGEAPRADEIAAQSRSIRGKRYLMVLTLIENPQPRNLPENRSGLKKIWEVFGSDSDGHLHRVDFIRKPKYLPSGSDVVMEGDFLRLYRYQTIAGQEAMVPHWVAQTLEPYQSPFVKKGNRWFPLSIIGALAVATLILLLVIQDRRPRRPLTRRRKS